jgi:cardiolipin synthase
MQLHRAQARPEWSAVTPDQRNSWQRLAAQTAGILTPGNLMTVAGVFLVAIGLVLLLNEQYWLSLVLVSVGRAFDLLDGWMADATGTKSPLGELFDATADKIVGIATLVVFFLSEIAPIWVLFMVFIPQIVISFMAVPAYFRHATLHPSRFGKNSMALGWVCLLGFWLIKSLGTDNAILLAIFDALAIASAVMGLMAIKAYRSDLKSADPSDAPSSLDN